MANIHKFKHLNKENYLKKKSQSKCFSIFGIDMVNTAYIQIHNPKQIEKSAKRLYGGARCLRYNIAVGSHSHVHKQHQSNRQQV